MRSKPFTRTHAVTQGDVTALLGEYGILISLTSILYLLAGRDSGDRRENE